MPVGAAEPVVQDWAVEPGQARSRLARRKPDFPDFNDALRGDSTSQMTKLQDLPFFKWDSSRDRLPQTLDSAEGEARGGGGRRQRCFRDGQQTKWN
ncbi:MAG: hypothetical protein Q8L13_14415 [Bradyrhizobium sp.]|uniref:hypothetical protein n=1 Tax=Bradyrhizobium sp. TaxID=376 RepID=UPI00272F5501|nr:hypothetical protein [Bradyrhizobium sp.]MDP1867518.1 hypothetical protein [Bradyrhizobium sp.]